MAPDALRADIDRVCTYSATLPEISSMPDPTRPALDSYEISLALSLAANLHNRELVLAMTRTRSVTDSAADLERIAQGADVDVSTAAAMRRVAHALRNYDTAHADGTPPLPVWVTVQDDGAICTRCSLAEQTDLDSGTVRAHLADPTLAHRHGRWESPSEAEQKVRRILDSINEEGPEGPAYYEQVVDALTPVIGAATARIARLEAEIAALKATPVTGDAPQN